MSPPSTVREALLIEAMGEVALLLERVESVSLRLDAARQAMQQAAQRLAHQVVALDQRLVDTAEKAGIDAVKHVELRTRELSRSTLETQRQSMQEAARTLFQSEIEPTLQRFVVPLRRLADRVEKIEQPGPRWDRWLAHAATATAASAVTGCMALYLVVR